MSTEISTNSAINSIKCFSDSGTSDFGADSTEEEEINEIYLKKIEFCAQKFSGFMSNRMASHRDTFRQLTEFNIANKGTRFSS